MPEYPPQVQGPQSPKDMAKRLVDLARKADAAQNELEELMIAALDDGASYRWVGEVVGMSHTKVKRIADRLGWPPKAERDRREREELYRNQHGWAKRIPEKDRWR